MRITRKRYKFFKKICVVWIYCLVLQLISPISSYALTSGPSTPEVSSFEPVGTNQMVDLFSGDFNYNIPLMDVGGYPINIAYHAGISMEQEASWVGLGWNINPGSINRNMRGIPDDFSGEIIEKNVNIKDNKTVTVKFYPDVEIIGVSGEEILEDQINVNVGLSYNNYSGIGIVAGGSFNAGLKMGSFGLGANLGVDLNSGINFSPSLSFSRKIENKIGDKSLSGNASVTGSFNSRQGLTALSFGAEGSYSKFSKSQGYSKESSYTKSFSGSMSNFNTPNFIPSSDQNSKMISYSFGTKLGGELPFTNINGAISGTYSKQTILGERHLKSYGYIYQDQANSRTDLLDFNREKDGPYIPETGVLALAVNTNDIYSISGQGVGGAYRSYRNKLTYLNDVTSSVESISAGIDGIDLGIIGSPTSFAAGLNIQIDEVNGYSGLWQTSNTAIDKFNNASIPSDNVDQIKFESTYFSPIGDMSVDNNKFSNIGEEEAIAFKLNGHALSETIQNDSEITVPVDAVLEKRKARNQLLQQTTFADAIHSNESKKIDNYKMGEKLIENSASDLNYLAAYGIKPAQIKSFSTIKPDGSKYVYGLPVFNIKTEETVFNRPNETGSNSIDYNQDMPYVPGLLGTEGNGIDDFTSVQKIPAYSYSHLLTEVQSADYSDLSGNGLTDDDLGSWVKFNYSCSAGILNPTNPEFKWRAPYVNPDRAPSYQTGYANFNEGLKTVDRDDKLNYTYGEKELWYNHSIETRDFIAFFYTSPRNDGHGVISTLGNYAYSEDNPIQKLDSISLFSKHDLLKNGSSAIALKTVHFEYDYQLNPGVYNNLNSVDGTGKLTLKKLYFTYGNSKKGKFSKYKFEYNGLNPVYNRRAQDRWGCYKEELTTNYNPKETILNPLSNSDNPYAIQDENLADINMSAWNLSNIELPSGGRINIEYESDDYAYIQDKRAGQMFNIVGLSKEVPNSSTNHTSRLFDLVPSSNDFNNFMTIKLDDIQGANYSKEQFLEDYLSEVDQLYFRCFVNLSPLAFDGNQNNYEFVSGYSLIEERPDGSKNVDVYQKNGEWYGWIKLKGVEYADDETEGKVNPIAKASWQFARLHVTDLVYPGSKPDFNIGEDFFYSLADIFTKDVPRMLLGFNRTLRMEQYASYLVPSKSFVRLSNPTYRKKGGGHRVKSINISDEWGNMATNAQSKSYGQSYFYEKEIELANGEMKVISSGVASYEPAIGGDENSLRKPLKSFEENLLAPDNQYYVEAPLGESFYPGASVGYSQVIVVDNRPDFVDESFATGFTVNQFYTNQDFPYYCDETETEEKVERPSPLNQIFLKRRIDRITASKGYSVILNNMHGKPKSNAVYNGAVPIVNNKIDFDHGMLVSSTKLSGVEYEYQEVALSGTNTRRTLNNEVNVINPDGSVTNAIIGVDSDISMDFRENRNSANQLSVSPQGDVWILPFPPFVPIPIITVWGFRNSQETRFRSSVITKVVNKNGLLKKVRAYSNGSIVETENMLYDAKTGDVLVTSVNNEFQATNVPKEDLIYNMQFPAHWAYQGMQQAYQNIGVEMDFSLTADSDLISISDADKIFHPGDKLLVKGLANGSPAYVTASKVLWVAYVDANGIKLIDRSGKVFNDDYVIYGNTVQLSNWNLKITDSGYTNQQSTPVANLVSLANPENTILAGNTNPGNVKVLDYSAVEFKDRWSTYCGKDILQIDTIQEEVFDCPSCADVIFLLDNSSIPVTPNKFELYELMKTNIQNKINEIEGLVDIDTRVAVIQYAEEATVSVDLTDDFIEASDFSYEYEFDSTANVEKALDKINKDLTVRSECAKKIYLLNFAVDASINPEGLIKGLKQTQGFEVNAYDYGYPDTHANLASFVSPASAQSVWTYGLYPNQSITANSYDSNLIPRKLEFPIEYFNTIHAFYILCGFQTVDTEITEILSCGVSDDDVINPFVNGIKGNWRVHKTYKHKPVNRTSHDVTVTDESSQAAHANLRTDGYYEDFSFFWNKPATNENNWSRDDNDYIQAEEITRYSPYGEALESKDALDNYSAVSLGYDKKLAIAVASNSIQRNFGFDGFEEYDFYDDPDICGSPMHMDFEVTANNLSNLESHSGFYSLKISTNSQFSKHFEVNSSSSIKASDEVPFTLSRCDDCIPYFDPLYDSASSNNNKMVVDMWVKNGGEYDILKLSQMQNGTEINAIDLIPTGPVIEGWQRVYTFFELDQNADQISFSFINNGGSTLFVDDIRVYPFDGMMNSYVYHPTSLVLMAQLDENNHATFYEYDEQWNLVRIKKETERGIVTLQESRSNIKLDRSE